MFFDVDNSLGFKVNRLAIILRQRLVHKFNESGFDVTAEEWILLNRLWQVDGRSQNELAESTIRDQTTVTRLVDKMEKKGFVNRKKQDKDRRIVLAYLTEKGKSLENKLIPIAMDTLSQASKGISKKEMDITLSTLNKCINNIL